MLVALNYEIQNKEAETTSYLREMSRLRVLHGMKPQDQLPGSETGVKTAVAAGKSRNTQQERCRTAVKKTMTIDLKEAFREKSGISAPGDYKTSSECGESSFLEKVAETNLSLK